MALKSDTNLLQTIEKELSNIQNTVDNDFKKAENWYRMMI